ncbi:MAG: hypothetical protein AAFV53_37510 [Myxococcota bacterium]
MSRWRKSLIPTPELDNADPDLLTPFDPYAGDEAVMTAARYAQYARYIRAAAPLPEAEHDALDRQFQILYRDVLDGTQPWSALTPVVAALALDEPRPHDVRPLNPSPQILADGILSDTAEDQVPDIGLIAPDRVLGPFADEPIPRAIRQAAGAVMAFAPLLQQGTSPVARAVHQKPRFPTEISSALRAIARTPPMLWQVEKGALRPLLPLSTQMIPTGDLGVDAGTVAIGRAVPLQGGGAWLACQLRLPIAPATAPLIRRLQLELWRLRRLDRRVSWEDMLRERSEVLYRAACEWSWLHDADAVLTLWQG